MKTNKQNSWPKWLFTSLLLISFFGAQAQEEPTWNLLEKKNGVEIFFYESACGRELDVVTDPAILSDKDAMIEANKKSVLLRFENSNSTQVDISWNAILRSDQLTTDSFLSLPGLRSSETNCSDSPIMQLTSQPDDGYPVSATDALSFLNITISSY